MRSHIRTPVRVRAAIHCDFGDDLRPWNVVTHAHASAHVPQLITLMITLHRGAYVRIEGWTVSELLNFSPQHSFPFVGDYVTARGNTRKAVETFTLGKGLPAPLGYTRAHASEHQSGHTDGRRQARSEAAKARCVTPYTCVCVAPAAARAVWHSLARATSAPGTSGH